MRVRLCSDWLESAPDWKKVIFTDEKISIWMDQTIEKLGWKRIQKLTSTSGSASVDRYGMGYAVTNG